MNDPREDGPESDIDPRFDPAASGEGEPRAAASKTVKSAQDQLDEMVTAGTAWAREKPLQALAVAAGLGFLLGRVGR